MKTNSADSINIIQITDTHLFATDDRRLQGYATNQLFSQAIEKIKSQTKKADFIFLTGDISEDHSAEAYEYAAARLNQLPAPVYWIAGNHDDAVAVQSIFRRYENLHALDHLVTPHWDFIAVNSCRAGTPSGYIEPDEMERFLVQLDVAKKNKKQVAVILHHHPVPIGTPLMDECMLQDNEEFLRVVKEHSEIKLVVCGHVHGDYEVDLGGKKLEACPAISFQWKKGTSTLETVDQRAFKYFRFEQGSYVSSVEYL
jgi:3',5'-cyclic-AMP phosphodiesterase